MWRQTSENLENSPTDKATQICLTQAPMQHSAQKISLKNSKASFQFVLATKTQKFVLAANLLKPVLTAVAASCPLEVRNKIMD